MDEGGFCDNELWNPDLNGLSLAPFPHFQLLSTTYTNHIPAFNHRLEKRTYIRSSTYKSTAIGNTWRLPGA